MMNRLTREAKLALFDEGFRYVDEALERFSKNYPDQSTQDAFRVGMNTLLRCIGRYNPEQGPFRNYLRASLRWEFKKLERFVQTFSDLSVRKTNSRQEEDGEEVEFDAPAQLWGSGGYDPVTSADASLAGLEGPGYDDELRELVEEVYRQLEETDPESAAVLRISIEKGLNLREIGKLLGRSHTTARKWRQKILKQARQILGAISTGLNHRPVYQKDWGETMTDLSLVRPYEEESPQRLPPGYSRYIWEPPRKKGWLRTRKVKESKEAQRLWDYDDANYGKDE